jgi:hypothetical protein
LDKTLSTLTEKAKNQQEIISSLVDEIEESRSKQDALVKEFCATQTALTATLDLLVAEMAADRTRVTLDTMNITNPLTADISLNTRVGNQIFLSATTVPPSIMSNK